VRASRYVSACAVSTQRAQVLTIRTCISKSNREANRNGGGAVAAVAHAPPDSGRREDGLSPWRHKRCRYYG